jgi:zinc transport system ATP-binding protein
MSTTDRVICLNGHVCCSGTPASVASSDEFKSLFGERAASGLALYQHRHDHEHLPDGSVESKEEPVTHNHHIDNDILTSSGKNRFSANRSNADV